MVNPYRLLLMSLRITATTVQTTGFNPKRTAAVRFVFFTLLKKKETGRPARWAANRPGGRAAHQASTSLGQRGLAAEKPRKGSGRWRRRAGVGSAPADFDVGLRSNCFSLDS
jgi:hypothetical protein